MKTSMIFALLLIALGVVAFVYQGIRYTSTEKIVDIGSLEVSAQTTKTLPLSPIVGALALAGGIGLLVWGRRG
ncbi:MAG: DUF3185 domain-containing protein [Desulfofustis sp.]|nr:DUF3185 domain-containing protein [Desulfofustis sp.]